MDMLTQIPTMTDNELTALQTNARRLQQQGTPAQQTAAAALIPAIEGEVAARKANKQPRPRATSASPKAGGKRAAARAPAAG